ncbi:DUF58 domain-containing protein [Halorarius halobius]|uniref:DUF58 domain-containing protein n=1 Tax=Halorarius halobius TaxID=2962671 RepID=UPI0020CBC2FB|nr:DUF58 domain-containing protein [Halorarius halobius]
MRLTRRGYAVLGVAVGAIALAAHAGPRSLNAVAGPAVVTLAYGVVTLARRDAPTVTRRKPAPGFPGETREVHLRVDADGPCQVRDRTGDGLHPVDDADRYVTDGEARYTVELLERGEHALGPASVTQRDTLGVVSRETRVQETTPALVYPVVEPVAPNRTFRGLVERAGTEDRDAFDTLREYVPGDALRDVHWKTSAKREPGELVVAEFARADEGGVTVVAEGDAEFADEMASAAASIAVYLLDADLDVELHAPGGRVRDGRGEQQRDDVLELLARTPAGRVGDVEADVRVRADASGVEVTANGRRFPFSELTDGVGAADDAQRQEVVA